MKKFKNHIGEYCLYITIKEGFILIMDDTFDEPYEFYYIGLGDYRRDPNGWRRHLSEKNWGAPELIDEIDRQVGIKRLAEAA